MDHFRGGLGIAISRYRVDYTIAPFGDLGLTQRFTLSATFGEPAREDQGPRNQQPHALKPADVEQISAVIF
jgi:hypothetical protein